MRWLALYQSGCSNCLRGLVDEGRVELLAGGWAEPILPALPMRDAVGQLELQARIFTGHLGQRPQGGWVSHGAWDPALVEIFSRADLGYCVLPGEAMLAAGRTIADTHGMWLTERGGKPIRLLPGDVTLSRSVGLVPHSEVLKVLERRRAWGAELVTLAMDVTELGERMPLKDFGSWLTGFFEALSENGHWLRTVVPSKALPKLYPRGRVYVPSWTPLQLAQSCLGRSSAQLLGDAPYYVRAGTWETLLSRYENVNRIHKRMWLASADVERLRRRMSQAEGDPDLARSRSLEQATVALYRAQGSATWFEGPEGGLYSPEVRNGVFESLAECESLVGRNLGDSGRIRTLRLDYDRDGHDEIIVRTPHFVAIVDPDEGGALTELSCFGVYGNVLDTTRRREEPWHARLDSYTKLPSLVLDEEVEEDEEEEDGPTTFELPSISWSIPLLVDEEQDTGTLQNLADDLFVDRYPRNALLDHFLGPATTPHNLARSAHDELGDFVGAPYALVSAERIGPGELSVVMTREGGVNLQGEARLVQIRKELRFSRDRPAIEITYELTNRFQTTVESRFAVEMTLSMPRGVAAPHLLADGVERLSLEEAGSLDNVETIRLDQGGGRTVVIRLPPRAHADLYHYPVNAIVPRDGLMASVQQGVCLVLCWPVQLWGEERHVCEFSLTIESPRTR